MPVPKDRPNHWLNLENAYGILARREIDKVRRDVGIEPLKPRMRNCLKCDREFQSVQNNNRMCDLCREGGGIKYE